MGLEFRGEIAHIHINRGIVSVQRHKIELGHLGSDPDRGRKNLRLDPSLVMSRLKINFVVHFI